MKFSDTATADQGSSEDLPKFVGAMLAGGQSSRFGSDKSLAAISVGPNTETGGTAQSMGAVVLGALRSAGADPVVVVGGTAGSQLSVPTIPDRKPGLGPLSGLASVLQWAGRGWVLVVPCDLPLLRAEHLTPLVDALAATLRTDRKTPVNAFVALQAGRPQPTVGLWSASLGNALHRSVIGGDRALRLALDRAEWNGVELVAEAFADADTIADLQKLETGQIPANEC